MNPSVQHALYCFEQAYGEAPESGEVLSRPHYYYEALGAAALADASVFDTAPAAGDYYSLKDAGRVPHDFVCYAIGQIFFGDEVDWTVYCKSIAVNLHVQETDYPKMPAVILPGGGGGIFAFDSGSVGTSAHATNGTPAHGAIYEAVPIAIPRSQSFELKRNLELAGTIVTASAVMHVLFGYESLIRLGQ